MFNVKCLSLFFRLWFNVQVYDYCSWLWFNDKVEGYGLRLKFMYII